MREPAIAWHKASKIPAEGRTLAGKLMAIICITNQKGGCGKTLTAVNLAAGLARKGQRVLVVDLDPQAPIAPSLSIDVPADLPPIAEAIRTRQLETLICASPVPHLFVTPGDVSLDHAAISNEPLRDTLLQRALQPVAGDFDFVLLDTPPNLDLVTLNAIMAADWLILPCDVDRESLQSLKRTLEVMNEYVQFRPEVDPETFYRVLITIYDPRDQVMNDWLATQVGPLGPTMFRSRIHRTTALKKARANGITIFDYAQRSRLQKLAARRAITDFDSLTQEVIDHEHTRSHRSERLALANSR